MACSRRYKNSFTLMEFLVILAIIAIVIGITITVFNQLQPSFQLNGTVRNLVTDLRYAQQLSVTEQINYCVKLFLAEKKYQIIQCAGGNPISEVFIPSEIATFSATGLTNNQVEFNPYGAAKESGNISLENTKNQTKTIEIKPSGFVRIIN